MVIEVINKIREIFIDSFIDCSVNGMIIKYNKIELGREE